MRTKLIMENAETVYQLIWLARKVNARHQSVHAALMLNQSPKDDFYGSTSLKGKFLELAPTYTVLGI